MSVENSMNKSRGGRNFHVAFRKLRMSEVKCNKIQKLSIKADNRRCLLSDKQVKRDDKSHKYHKLPASSRITIKLPPLKIF